VGRYQQYQQEITNIRGKHIVQLQAMLKKGEEEGWLIYKKPVAKTLGWFSREENIRYKMAMISVLLLCWWVSIIGIYNKIYLQEAVSRGLRVLDKVSWYAWVAFCLFIALELIYYYSPVFVGFKSLGSIFGWLLGGCKFDAAVETRFETPKWVRNKDRPEIEA